MKWAFFNFFALSNHWTPTGLINFFSLICTSTWNYLSFSIFLAFHLVSILILVFVWRKVNIYKFWFFDRIQQIKSKISKLKTEQLKIDLEFKVYMKKKLINATVLTLKLTQKLIVLDNSQHSNYEIIIIFINTFAINCLK